MGNNKKQEIVELFKSQNYKQLYQTQSQVINEMLLIYSQEEFEDFLNENNSLDDLEKQLPTDIFNTIKDDIQQIYVDLDAKNNLEERIRILNKKLEQERHLIRLDYDETYCAGVYFLSVGY